MRNSHYFEALRPVTIVSNTASATSAKRPYLQTSGAATNFIVGTAAANTVTFSFKTVDAAGEPIAAVADIGVACTAGGNTVDTLASTSGTLLSPTVTALIAGGVAGTAFVAYTAQILSDSTTGIATATFHFTGDCTVTATLRYGDQQVVAEGIVL